MKHVHTLLIFAIFSAAYFGDYIVFKSKYSSNQIFRAFADNSVHSAVGFLSSLLFFSHEINITSNIYIYNVFLCTAVSSLIDVDHFILAKSFYFADLENLKQRGFLHCTTLWLTITTMLLIYSQLTRNINIYITTFMLIIAFMSHHLRDANRRGLWLYPYGHTPPINKHIYIIITSLLPLALAYIFNIYKPYFSYTIVRREIV